MAKPRQNRRQFVKGIAALGAASFLSGPRSMAQTPPANPRAIDVHQHYSSPAYLKALQAKDGKHTAGYTTWFALQTWNGYSNAKVIEDMDKAGVATGMLSCTTPGVWFGNPAESRALAREMNEYGAKFCSDYKGRLGLWALLPLPDIDGSLKEIQYAFDTLKADGIGLMTSYDLHWFGDPLFQPVFDELNRRNAIVYSHPIDSPCCQDIQPGINPPTLEYNTDTARTILSLISGNPMPAARYPNIKFIFSHGGGTMPSLIERFGVGAPDTIADVLARPAEPNSRLFHLRRFFYDCAQSTNPVQLQGLKTVAGIPQMLFGSDYPFGAGQAKHLIGLAKCGFNADELRAIQRENALKMLPKYVN